VKKVPKQFYYTIRKKPIPVKTIKIVNGEK